MVSINEGVTDNITMVVTISVTTNNTSAIKLPCQFIGIFDARDKILGLQLCSANMDHKEISRGTYLLSTIYGCKLYEKITDIFKQLLYE